MAISETSLCNMSLGRIGANRISNIETDSSLEGVQCRLHYDQTRDALLRKLRPRFARTRATLSASDTTPSFEWDYQYILPTNFLSMISIYEDGVMQGAPNVSSYVLEGNMLLSNETSMQIRYVKKTTDPMEFDPIFVEVLVLVLAGKLIMPLSKSGTLKNDLMVEIDRLIRDIKSYDQQETNTVGTEDMELWNDARY